MIDWMNFTARLTHSERLFAGRMIVITPDGDVTFERDRALPVEGSHSSQVQVLSQPDACGRHGALVRVSGNPAKFLQGHNVFGSNDLRGLGEGMLERICERVGIEPTQMDRASWHRGDMGVTMADVTESWELESRQQVRSALQSMSQLAHLRNRGGAVTTGGTLYWGKHSRRWALKAYGKGDELEAKKKSHRLPFDLPMRDELSAHADRLLRFELRLHALELKRQFARYARHWLPGTAELLHSAAMQKLEISEAAMLKPHDVEGLPPRLVMAYQSWLAGNDMRALLPTRTFYRYRRELLTHGIDIALARPRTQSNVIPLRVVLHARPVSVPEWARGTSLYYEPRRAV